MVDHFQAFQDQVPVLQRVPVLLPVGQKSSPGARLPPFLCVDVSFNEMKAVKGVLEVVGAATSALAQADE